MASVNKVVAIVRVCISLMFILLLILSIALILVHDASAIFYIGLVCAFTVGFVLGIITHTIIMAHHDTGLLITFCKETCKRLWHDICKEGEDNA